jgi:hypothetical protein
MTNNSSSGFAILRDEGGAVRNDGDQLDSAGEAILKLLNKAAGAVEANSRQALETAQKLSRQLREAEDRIAELEAENQLYREKSERAEEWLHRVYAEVRSQLFRQSEAEQQRVSSRR